MVMFNMVLFSPHNLRDALPLSYDLSQQIACNRRDIANILRGQDRRFVIMTGPCSLHHRQSAMEYAHRLVAIQKKVRDRFLIVMRAHVEKPRTGIGWSGMIYDPYLSGKENIAAGLKLSRRLLLELAVTGVPLATEFLDPITAPYFSDLISWGFIGARTSASSIHRKLASYLPMPIGFKNSIEGDVMGAIRGAEVARFSHSILAPHIDTGKIEIIQSTGNADTHIVLRGSDHAPNYDAMSVRYAAQTSSFLHRKLLIDCAHGNSGKEMRRQKEVFMSVISQYQDDPTHIAGVMMESHLCEGKQPFSAKAAPDQSITDACIGWEETEKLILFAYHCASSSLKVMSCVHN